jgi:HK97 family phage major capsid protein
MPAIADLKENMRDLAIKAHEVVLDEKMTGAEKREALDKYDPEIKALAEQIKDAEYLMEQDKSLSAIINGGGEDKTPDPAKPVRVKGFGEQFTDSEGFQKAMKAVGSKIDTGPIALDGLMSTAGLRAQFMNATLTESGLTSGSVIAPDYQPGILPILFERPVVADLMMNTTTTSNTVRYAKESVATNAAAPTAEGAAKPASTLNFTVVDEPIRKIATTIKNSDEILQDIPQMQSYVGGRLVLFVRLDEEAELLGGDGTGVHLVGFLNRSGKTAAQAKGTDTIAIAVHKEITKIRVGSFLEPDGIVFHPNDWEQASLETDANGQFYGGGPFSGAYGTPGTPGALQTRPYWGLRPVSTTAMTENTALLGAFQLGAEVVRRTGITVEVTNSNEDDFLNNLVAFRAEERVGLKVYRPAAFGTVTGI